jgi:hypothetical protein
MFYQKRVKERSGIAVGARFRIKDSVSSKHVKCQKQDRTSERETRGKSEGLAI